MVGTGVMGAIEGIELPLGDELGILLGAASSEFVWINEGFALGKEAGTYVVGPVLGAKLGAKMGDKFGSELGSAFVNDEGLQRHVPSIAGMAVTKF